MICLITSMDKSLREHFEELLNKVHNMKFEIISDFDRDNERVVILKRYSIRLTLKASTGIDFDVYCDLSSGIYELGDLHLLTRTMLEIKKLCLAYDAREMNTTERLYPENRQGKLTQTSGL